MQTAKGHQFVAYLKRVAHPILFVVHNEDLGHVYTIMKLMFEIIQVPAICVSDVLFIFLLFLFLIFGSFVQLVN